MGALRTFIAIDIPPWVKEQIAGIQNRFKSLDLNASWVRPENIHLTLKFLGDIDPQRVPLIKETMTRALNPIPKFSVWLGGLGVYPDLKRPRVLWVGLRDSQGALETLHEKTDDALNSLGFPKEPRKFSPHLTFGRLKSQKGKSSLEKALQEGPEIESDPFEISSVKFYQSQLTRTGSIYTALDKFILNG